MTQQSLVPPVIAMLACFAMAGCISSTPVFLPAGNLVADRAVRAGSCNVDLLAARDVRQHPETLGTVLGRPVRSPEDPQAWLANVLQALRASDIEVTQRPERSTASAVAMEAELRDAWVSALSSAKTASAVVHIRYLPRDGEPVEKVYRGRDSSMNWSSGDDEIRQMMDRVFADIRAQVAKDIRPYCPPAPPT